MSVLKTRLHLVTLAVALATAGMIAGCNSDDDNNEASQTLDADANYRKIAEEMLAKLTLSEKLNILSGPGMDLATYQGIDATNLAEDKDVVGVAGYINGTKNAEVDIPAVKLADGPAGVRISPTRDGQNGTFYATAWPIGTLLASSWNTDLVEQVGKAEGNEVKEYGLDFLLAPGMNIQRNPLLGRNFEYYSEDPVVTGKIAAAMVNGIESNNVGATIKHFFANNSESNRFFSNSIVDPRTSREIYLRGFQIAVKESHPWAVMSPYNKLNGIYVNQRKDVLTDILRNEWGFKGLVMSDWYAGNVFPFNTDFSYSGIRDTESAAKQIKAGNDLIEPGGVKDDLAASVKNGTLTETDIDKSVVAILTQVQKTPSYSNYVYSNNPDLNSHALLARKAATEGMILLKNESLALPLAARAKIASFGTTQINTLKGGTGSGDVNAAYITSIATGLAQKFTLNTAITSYYTDYWQENKYSKKTLLGSYEFCDEPSVSENNTLQQLISEAATTDEAAIITIGRQAGEGEDRKNTSGDYQLTNEELELINTVSNEFHAKNKTVTVVLNVNGLIDTSSWANKVDSILLAYMGGQETGNAVADILSGEENPSGKLAQTIPISYEDVPSSSAFPGIDIDGDGWVDNNYYNEGIYVGYRYYTSFSKPVAYPFGYGLSYTTFGYSDITVTSNTLDLHGANGKITITATIRNTGEVAGKEIAQVYISAPEVKLHKPTIELKAFDKTDLLAAGNSEILTFTIDAETLASFDPSNNQWIVEPGVYKVYVAPSSDVKDVSPVTFTIKDKVIVSSTTPGALALPENVNLADYITVSEQ